MKVIIYMLIALFSATIVACLEPEYDISRTSIIHSEESVHKGISSFDLPSHSTPSLVKGEPSPILTASTREPYVLEPLGQGGSVLKVVGTSENSQVCLCSSVSMGEVLPIA
jgi:hypothetical protein